MQVLPTVEAMVQTFVERIDDLDTAVRAAVTTRANSTPVTEPLDRLLMWGVDAMRHAAAGMVEEPLHVALAGCAEELDDLFNALTDTEYNQVSGELDACDTALDAVWPRVVAEIQRPSAPRYGSPSFGFEWQLTDVTLETDGVPSKTLLKSWMHGNEEDLRLEVDGRNIEFITMPVTTLADLNRQLDLIRAEAALIQQALGGTISYALPVPALDDETGEELLPTGFQVTVRRYGTPHGKLQATTGRRLDQLTELLLTFGGELAAEAKATMDGYNPVGQAAPLLYLVRMYLVALSRAVRDHEGPKVLFPVMSRTDFHSAYLRLNGPEQASFKTGIDYHGENSAFDDVRAARIAPFYGVNGGGYYGPAGALYEGPTVGAWLDSIVDGDPATVDNEPTDRDNDGEGPRGDHRDLLSPPQGYPAHRRGRHFTYAMGRFGTAADGALLLELRAIEADTAYSFDNMRAIAVAFATSQLADPTARLNRIWQQVQQMVTTLENAGGARNRFAASVRRQVQQANQNCPVTELMLAETVARYLVARLPDRVQAQPARQTQNKRKRGDGGGRRGGRKNRRTTNT